MFTIYCIIGVLTHAVFAPYVADKNRKLVEELGQTVIGRGISNAFAVCVSALIWPAIIVWNIYSLNKNT